MKNPFGNHIGKRGSPNYDFLPKNDADRFQSSSENELNNRANGLWFPANRFPVDFNNLNSHSLQHIPSNSGSKDSLGTPMMGDTFYQPVNPLQSLKPTNANPNLRPDPDRFFGRPPLNQLQNDFYFGAGASTQPLSVNSDPQIAPISMNKPTLSELLLDIYIKQFANFY